MAVPAMPWGNSYMIRNLLIIASRRARRGPDWCARAIEILSILSRAHAAASHYEDLKRGANADLASRGIRRADLPRIAFHMLTAGCEVSDTTAHGTERDCHGGQRSADQWGTRTTLSMLLRPPHL